MSKLEELIQELCPDGVEYKKISSVCDILTGYPFDSKSFTKVGIRLMRGINVKRGYLTFKNDEDNRYWKNVDGLEKYLLNEGDIIVAMDGSLVGKSFGIVKESDLPLLLVQRVARIRATSVNQRFIYHFISHFT